MAIFSQRSWRLPFVSAASDTSVRAVIVGWIAATPIITASRTTSSILSPLRTACSERHVDARLGRRRRLLRPHRHQDLGLLRLLDHRIEFAAAAVEDANRGARLEPKDTRQMLGLVFGERDDLAATLRLGHVETSVHRAIIDVCRRKVA